MRNILLVLTLLAAGSLPATCQGIADLHDFTGVADGFSPYSTLVETSAGVFFGGSAGYLPSGGAIFSITPSGVFTPVYELVAAPDGDQPIGQLFPASNGLLYGVTFGYGPNTAGTIFAASADGKFSVIQSNVKIPTPLVEGSDGNFYGIDGNYDGGTGTPTFFKVSAKGQKTTLGTFPGKTSVSGTLVQATDGNFYGSTTAPNATVFRFSPAGKYSLLHQFKGAAGANGQLVQASNGLLYGATFTPYAVCGTDKGVVFSLSLTGQLSVVHEFGCALDGSGPSSGLMQASDGYLYGTCTPCGTGLGGSIYKLSPDGSSFTTLADFTDALFSTPGSGVIQGSDGSLYGTSAGGGANNLGFIFSLAVGAPPPLPALSYTLPSSAAPGSVILIRGANLLAATQVTFNGVPASFSVKSVDYVAAVVPAAASSGPITVTTPNGAGTSSFSFAVN